MAGAKEIRTKIASVQNTQKITSAMQMVAASKMRRAQDKMSQSRPYSAGLLRIIGHIAASHSEFKHPYMVERPVKNVGFVIVSTDRGLCGGLNINLFRQIIHKIDEFKRKNIGVKVVLLGSKASSFFIKSGVDVVAAHSGFGDNPSPEKLVGSIKVMTDGFLKGETDEVYLCFNRFKNTMVQLPSVQQLLPLMKTDEEKMSSHHWDYLYEPDPEAILDVVLDRYELNDIVSGAAAV